MPIRLEVDDGETVRTVETARDAVTVGRARDAELRIDVGGVSRRHARLRVVGAALEVVDLDSKNGVHVNGRPVTRELLSPGRSFEMGGARVTVIVAAQTDAPPTPGPLPAAPRPSLVVAHGLRPAPDFDDLVWKALHQVPWFMISIGLHALVLLVLTVVDLGLSPPPRPAADVVVALKDGTVAEALDERIRELNVDNALDDLERRIPDDWTDDPLHFDPVLATDEDDDPLQDAPDTLAPAPAPFGLQGLGDAPLGIAAGIGGTPLGRSFGKDQAGDANTFAAHQLRSSPFARRLLEGLRLRCNPVAVRVLGGEYDQCEQVLDRLGLEHDTMLPGELDLARPGAEIRAVFYNCTSKPLTPRALDHIERFVHAGGFLFTTDWGLENVLEPRFSAYVRTLRRNGRVVMTDDEVVTFAPVAGHPLLRGLPTAAQESRWWLENSSILIDIVDPRSVDVLIESADLERRHGSRVVAVTFAHGRGRVVHVLGHIFQKEGNLRGTVAMQRILLNFLYQALQTH